MPVNVVAKDDPHPEQRVTYSEQEIIERVAFWQKALGLDNWLIHVSVIPGFNLEGHCQRYLGSFEAHIKIRQDQRHGDAERTLVHELLHIVTGPWKDAYMQSLKSYNSEMEKFARNFVVDAEEEVIESLAELFVRIAGGDWFGGRLYGAKNTPEIDVTSPINK